jgi:DNA-directed RNA polymerase subunit K/omega
MSLTPVELTKLEGLAANIYEAIVVMSRRARQINEEVKIALNQELENFTPRVDSEEEIETNPEQMRISVEFEKMPKPTQRAIDDMLAGELTFRYRE